MDAISRVIAIARAEVGYLEKASNSQLDSDTANAGYNNYTKYARDLDRLGVYNYHKQGYEWCDMFFDWVMITAFGVNTAWKMTYQEMKGCGAGCTYSARYYKNNGRFFKNPKPGDQIFFSQDGGETSYHTGLVIAIDSNYVYTIEGNTSSSPGVVANGGSVNEKRYSLSYAQIGGYGRPNYSIVEEDEDDMDVTRFGELWREYRKTLQDNDASSYSEEARIWAIQNGLINGNGTEINGEPNYMYADILTREQFITVLYRFAQLMGKA